jgi:predicted transposase YbfD/YdcC
MQDTPTATPVTTAISFALLHAQFAALPDPRRAQGRRFPLAALLTLAVAAILANHLSVLAIAEWGAAQSERIRRALGFTGDRMPHQTTLHRLFARLDARLLAATLARALAEAQENALLPRGAQAIAVDGKAQRGRLAGQPIDASWSSIHMLSALCHETGLVLAQMPVIATGDKAAAELATAPVLIAQLDWHGRVLTGDALYCQRGLCQQVLDAGGDYLVSVKQNQQALHRDITILFAHRADAALNAASLPAQDLREAVTENHGHGREERRTLTASRDLNDYLDWPGVRQVFMVERVWRERGREKGAVQYGITSLPMAQGGATRLLACKRGHWGIENGLHHVKDVTLGEDASRVRVGQGPNVLALLRDTALNVLRSTGCRTIAARLRHHCRCPDDLLILLDLPLTEHA